MRPKKIVRKFRNDYKTTATLWKIRKFADFHIFPQKEKRKLFFEQSLWNLAQVYYSNQTVIDLRPSWSFPPSNDLLYHLHNQTPPRDFSLSPHNSITPPASLGCHLGKKSWVSRSDMCRSPCCCTFFIEILWKSKTWAPGLSFCCFSFIFLFVHLTHKPFVDRRVRFVLAFAVTSGSVASAVYILPLNSFGVI